MKDRTDIESLLNDYLDGTLAPEARRAVEAQMASDAEVRAAFEALREARDRVAALPKEIAPPADLWPGIAARLGAARAEAPPQALSHTARPRSRRRIALAAAAVVVAAVGLGALWFGPRLLGPSWQVARLEGVPRIGGGALDHRAGLLRQGQWLETDGGSRARLHVGAIGDVEVAPNSRLQLLNASPTDQRLALRHGSIHARIWAPPRLFVVETPSARAVDLGCEYTLDVDSTGVGLLHVTSGYVSLESRARTVVVPAGTMAATRPGAGPGTPFDDGASDAFRAALDVLDFGGGDREKALATLLASARDRDGVTLWNLRARLGPGDWTRVYDRLAALVPAPPGVTRAGVLAGDSTMHQAWEWHLGLDASSWWPF